jgi:serine/threonine-protein kinase
VPSDRLRDQLRTTLGSAYAIDRELGGGGMSRVFVARDVGLERDVVVKVLSPELAAGVSAERFTREIKLAAGLQQANIVPLLSAGETEGLPYYTMPFVDGLSLRARLERNGALPVGEAVSVLRDVTRALAYAHAHGVVHRDIKPENILLSGHAAVVTDFGIAKALSASRTVAPGGTLTQVGTSIGTPAYMAPEQALGDPATDHRADLYALGCVAYEMLAGTAPFAGRPVHQLFAAHLNETPAPHEKKRPDVPRALAQLVARCLEKDPARRPQRADEVLAALDRVGVGADAAHRAEASFLSTGRGRVALAAGLAVVALVAALGIRAMRGRATVAATATATAVPADSRSIAVLPFENLGDSADAYFADGITDAVRGKLTALPGLKVIARASSVSYRGSGKTPQDIARELGVHYLLTGTVRFAGAGAARRVQVSPELVEVAPGQAPESRWQQPFDAAVKDVFGVQADIASRVASAMQVALGGSAQAQLAQAPTRDPAAYDAFLRGEAISRNAPTEPMLIRRAMAAYEVAIRRDSSMRGAWAALAEMSSSLYFNSQPTSAVGETARRAAERAIALDSTRSEGWAAFARYHQSVTRDLDQALRAASRARQLAPQDPAVRITAANLEQDRGQIDLAVQDLAEASRLDPRSVRVWSVLARTLLRLGRVAEARAAAERALAVAPSSFTALLGRVMVEAAAGDVPSARQVVARGMRDIPAPAVVAGLATYLDFGWVLDSAQSRLLFAQGPEAFDGDRATRAIVFAQQCGWSGDSACARAWGDSAARETRRQVTETPNDPQRHVFYGLALAYVGRRPEALAEVERGLALQAPTPQSRTVFNYAYLAYVGARAALVAGDRDRALAWLADARRYHYYATPAWLGVEPSWTPLRGDPRFAAMVAASPTR